MKLGADECFSGQTLQKSHGIDAAGGA